MARFADQFYKPLTQSNQASTEDYTQGMTRSVFSDPRFLKDIRTYYSSKGLPVAAMDDGELINRMLSDGTWREMGNSVSVVKGLAEANNATAEERERLRRIQAVYDIAPGVFQEGGRGAAGFFDNVAAAIVDPVNLIGGIAGKGAAQAATRTALATGATAREAGRAGLKSGIGKAAVSEAAIGAGIEGITNVGTQMRDVQLGIQDEVSLGQAAGSAALAAGLGGVLGGAVAVPSAAAGVRAGRQEFDQLSNVFRGAEDPNAVIAGLTNQKAADILSDPETRADTIKKFAPVGPQIPPGGIPAASAAPDPKLTLDAQRLEDRITGLRREYDSLTSDGLFTEAAGVKTMLDRVANLRGMQVRLAEEANTIDKLTKSEQASDLAEAASRRSRFEEDFALYRAVIADPENPAYDEALKRAMTTPATPKPGKSAPETTAAPAGTDAPATSTTPPASAATDPAASAASAPADAAATPAPTADAAAPAASAKPKGGKKAAVTPAPEPKPAPAADQTIITPAPEPEPEAGAAADAANPAAEPTPDVINAQPAAPKVLGRDLAAQFLQLTKPLLASGMTRTDMARALGMITRGLGMDEKEAKKAIVSFENRIENMRKRGELRAGDDMDLSQGGIFDRMTETLKLGSEDAMGRLMSLRAKLTTMVGEVKATDAAERAADAGVEGAVRPAPKADDTPLIDKLSKEENEVLNLVIGSEARENPDFTPQQARLSAIARIINGRDLPEKSGVSSNAARMEAMAPANPKGRGTTSTPISKGSDYTVSSKMRPSEATMGLDVARATQAEAKRKNKALDTAVAQAETKVKTLPQFLNLKAEDEIKSARARGISEEEERKLRSKLANQKRRAIENAEIAVQQAIENRNNTYDIVIPFTSTGTVKNVADGKPMAKGEKGFIGVDGRVYRVEKNARNPKGSAGDTIISKSTKSTTIETPSGTPTADESTAAVTEVSTTTTEPKPASGASTASTEVSLTALLQRFDPKGDGTGDGAGLFKALQDLSEGRTPDLTPAKAKPTPKSAAGGLLIIRSKSEGVVRMMSPGQVERGASIDDLLGASKAKDWEVRYTPADTVHTRDPQKLAEIFERSVPEVEKPKAAEVEALTFAQAQGINIDLAGEDKALWKQASGEDADAITLVQLAEAIHNYENGTWAKIKDGGGIQAYADTLQKLYAMQARVNPLGVVFPQQTRKEGIEALENIFGARNPAETAAAVRLLEKVAGDRAPVMLGMQDGTNQLGTFYGRGQQVMFLSSGKSVVMPRVMNFYHEMGHWAYYNILTPEDRMYFWRDVAAKYMDEAGNVDEAALGRGLGPQRGMTTPGGAAYNTNAYDSPQEFFAQQFQTWAARKLSGDQATGALDESLWKKVSTYIKALYDRYVRGVEIDPALEPLFSKILPEDQRILRSSGIVRNPNTDLGKAIHLRLEQTRYIKKDIEKAIAADNADGIITAFQDGVRHLLSLSQDKDMGTGAFTPTKTLMMIMRQRVKDIDQIVTGQRFAGPEDADSQTMSSAAITDGMTIMGDPQEVADNLVAAWRYGYQEGGITPEDAKVQAMLASGKIKSLENTTISAVFNLIESKLVTQYQSAEGGIPSGVKVKTQREANVSPDAKDKIEKTLKTAVVREKRVEKAVDNAAKATATGKGKPAKPKPATAGKAKPSEAPTVRDSLKLLSEKDLRAEYLAARKAGDQLRSEVAATQLIAKQQAKPVPVDKVKLPSEFRQMGKKELNSAFLDALYVGDETRISQAAYEVTRRAANKEAGKSGQPMIQAIYDKSVESIEQEVRDNFGAPISVGIPPNARAQIRELLSFITHREPMTQFTLRTMAYRMLNMMGKTVHKSLDDTSILSTDEMARLANIDPSRVTRAAFVDFRGDEFKSFRSDLRRVAIGLNKGVADPIDLMHEIGHMVMRTGVLSREEADGIRELFRASNDPTKDRIVKLYGGKYVDRMDGEQLLAEEWFAEQLALYMAERVSRGDILEAAVSGDFSGLRLRGAIDRAIDRVTEFVAYTVNGLLGNNDLRQTFRRLTFYGDMFQAKSAPPLSKDVRIAVHPSYAAAYAADRFLASPKNRADTIMNFVGRGAGLNEELGEPLVYFHGTPRGDKLGRSANPDAILLTSRNGLYGPGIYLTEDGPIADTIFSRRPTRESLERQYMSKSTDPNYDDVFQGELDALDSIRQSLVNYRQEYTNKLFDLDKADAVSEEIILEDIQQIRDEIDLLVAAEKALMEGIVKDYDMAYEPLVMPLYVRMNKPADFQMTTRYEADDPFIRVVTDHLVSQGLITRKAADEFTSDIETAQVIKGNSLYHMLTTMIEKKSGGAGAAKVRMNGELEKLGFDGLITTHINMGSFGDDLAEDGIAYAGEPVRHRSLVVFNSNNVKHIEAAEFDASSPRVYYRQSLPTGTAGTMVLEALDNSLESLSSIHPARVGETAEAAGADRGLSGALMSMMRRRPPSANEQRALADSSPSNWFRSQSSRMERAGMNWMANDYKEYFPKVYERFAARFTPLLKKINALPDAQGGVSGWFYKASGGVGQKAPESNAIITRGIRNGKGSRQWNAMTPQQREIAEDVMATFRSIYRDLRKAGVWLGDLGENYVPQVWNKEMIVKNKDEFLNGMANYHNLERSQLGLEQDQQAANDFANRMYVTLADIDADGTFIPGGPSNGASRNTTADNLDFNRMIRLNEFPEAARMLDKFLENDILSLSTKYIEAAERRLQFVNKWGVNGHAYFDYRIVAARGPTGIAALLSKNKQFKRDFNFLNEIGEVEEAQLIREVPMPFQGRDAEAREFAKRLMEAHATGGGATVRKMLMEIAPVLPSGGIPNAYERRVDAIVGALDDFKGKPALVEDGEDKFLTNAMQVLMQKRQVGTLEAGYRFSNYVRNFNNISLLGFTTLTSLGDLAMPLIRSGSMKDYVEAMKNFAVDPEYREMIFNTGVAIESLVHERMLGMYGGTSDRFNQAFFNATLLTPWTDFTRQVAGAVGFEHLKTQARIAANSPKDSRKYRIADRTLRRYGLGEFLPGGTRQYESITPELGRTDEAVRFAIVRFADDAVFVPNPNDIPLWAQTPIGKIIFQLKSYPLMMSRMAGDLINEFRQGNVTPLLYLLSVGPAFGATALAVKDVVQMRGGEDGREPALRPRSFDGLAESLGFDPALHGDVDTFMNWYVESLMLAGGFGLVGDILYGVGEQIDNGAYGYIRTAGLIGGPTVSLGYAGFNVAAGGADAAFGLNESNAKERSGVREVVSRIPVLGGVRAAREGITDAIAGEAMPRGNGFSTQDWATKGWATEQ